MFPTPAQAAAGTMPAAPNAALGGALGTGGAGLMPPAPMAGPGASDMGGAAPGTGAAGPGAGPGSPFFAGLTDDQKARMALDYATTRGKNWGDIAKPNIQIQNGMVIDMNKIPPGTSLPTGEGIVYRPVPGQPGKFMVERVQGMTDIKQQDTDIAHSHDYTEVLDAQGNKRRVLASSPAAQNAITQMNPAAQQYQNAMFERDAKKLGNYMDQREAAPGQIANLDQLQQGLEQFAKTGQSPKQAAFEQVMKNYLPGYKAGDALQAYQLTNSVANQMSLELRNPASGAGMPGSMSDSDRTFLQSMVASPGTDINAARQMIAARQATYRRSVEVGDMASKWAKSYGSLSGTNAAGMTFYDALSNWSNKPENALFKPLTTNGGK
jgi:hypothetical protein